MFNIFKKKETAVEKKERMIKEVEEIHESFYTEIDKLLEYAIIREEVKKEITELDVRAARLKKLGFTNAPEVKEIERRNIELQNKFYNNREKEFLANDIKYFTKKYPLYRFITHNSAIKLCEKYGLILGGVDNFIGEIPEKNLKEIENFKIQDEDACWMYNEYNNGWGDSSYSVTYSQYKKAIELDEKNRASHPRAEDTDFLKPAFQYYTDSKNDPGRFYKDGFKIVAPEKEFDTSNMRVVGYELKEVEDPIVLCPVQKEGRSYYLIVSAWGPEASDQEVINSKMN